MDLVAQGTQANQQVQAAAMAESNQLERLPLSALSADDSGPPQVTYGSEQPLAASTPRATSTSKPETQTTETYCQITPGMSNCLYPTLVADGSLSTHVADNRSTLQDQITSEIVSLIMYATKLEIDLCNFPAIWAVLSILLDTQSNELQYVKNLQQVVDDYYDKHPTEVMSRLEHQITDIMNAMYDSATNDDFDSVSDDTDRVSGAVLKSLGWPGFLFSGLHNCSKNDLVTKAL